MGLLQTRIGDVVLENPVMPASGTFGVEMTEVFDLDRLGALVLKTVTPDKRRGNPVPRVCELPGGMMNSIGIPSKGASYLIEETLPLLERFSAPVVVSVSASSAEDFAAFAHRLDGCGIAAIEVNISCPNIEDDGRAFALSETATADVIGRMRRATSLPLWAKLSPAASDIAAIARAAEGAGADAIVSTNTLLGMAVDPLTGRFRLGNVMGGLSGPLLKPVALRATYQCVRAVTIPVIGCGGIASVDDILEYLMVGARAVQVGTASFLEPAIMPRLVDELADTLRARGLETVEQLIGTVKAADETIELAELV